MNTYGYVRANPIVYFDQFGLEKVIINADAGAGSNSTKDGWGHSWVTGVDANGVETSWGSWPTEAAGKESILPWKDYPGMISEENGRVDGDHERYESKEYEVTAEQYKKLIDFINKEKNKENRKWSLRDNCTDFAIEAAESAGIEIDDYTNWGYADPAALAESLKKATSTNGKQK